MNGMWAEAKARVSNRLATHLRVEPFRLLNETPLVSFTFDDIPRSAATTGAAILSDHDARGTFYISGSLVGAASSQWAGAGAEAEDIVSLQRDGHEIGCHTFSHKRASDLDAPSLAEEIAKNRQYLRTIEPAIQIENFAYPFGCGSFLLKRQLRTEFKSCRGVMPGVNSGTVDLQFLRALPLINREIDRDRIDRALDRAQATNGWLIFYTHDVAERPSPYGCSPALMDHALKAATRRNIRVANVAEALQCAGA